MFPVIPQPVSISPFGLCCIKMFAFRDCFVSCWLVSLKKSLNEFWPGLRMTLPTISKATINKLLTFWTTYLCKLSFSASMIIKSRYWSTGKYWRYSMLFSIKESRLFFRDRVSLRLPGYPGTSYVYQADSELTEICLSTGIKGVCHRHLTKQPRFDILWKK